MGEACRFFTFQVFKHGKPHVIVTDNGRQFESGAFEDFLRKNGVRHLKTTPRHPASNGVIERTVQTFKRLLTKFQCGDIHMRLARVLYSMRTSPSSRNGKTPVENLGRPSRDAPHSAASRIRPVTRSRSACQLTAPRRMRMGP